ncbi:MAG: VPLPA-CTERM sorting domain-containing protein, partial [Boseongicola sp.]|nr:VPLPA-CTERM sorting domain-containing protein [Boseongicola sp.]
IIDPAPNNFASNGDTTTAIFSIFKDGIADAVYSATISATQGGTDTEDLFNYSGEAGVFTLVIDGQRGSPGATYDIGISAVPLPAAGWLLLAGVGGLAAMKRRKTMS